MSINASWAPPNETSHDIWTEVATLIGQTTLGGAAYGILVTLYVLCLSALIPQLKNRANKKWALFHIIYATLLSAFVGVGIAGDAVHYQFWTTDRGYPNGGPLGLIHDQAKVFRTVAIWDWVGFIIAALMQDAYVVYRCLVFWEYNYYVCALPVLCFIGLFPASVALIVEISRPQAGLTSKIFVELATVFYALSISLNVIGTIAIISRLVWKRRTIAAVLGREHSKVYTGVVAMLIESAAAYSVVGLIFIGLYFTRNVAYDLVIPFVGALEGICPLVIIYRIAIGRGWTNQTNNQINTVLSSLEFGRPQNSSTKATGNTSGAVITHGDTGSRASSNKETSGIGDTQCAEL